MSNLQIIAKHFTALSDAEYVTILGWLLDTGHRDPVMMSDDLADALLEVSTKFRAVYPALEACGFVEGRAAA